MLGFIGIRRLSFANLVQRSFSSSAYERAMSREKVKLTFIGKLDEKIQVDAFVGDTLLDVSQQNSLDVEGNALLHLNMKSERLTTTTLFKIVVSQDSQR